MLLISPMKGSFGGAFSRYMDLPAPIAIGTLAGYMLANDIDTRVFDEQITELNHENFDSVIEGLERPLVVGITCMTAHVSRAYEIALWVKAEYPDSIIIAGGIHPTALPDEVISHEGVDFVVRGEGEAPLLQLYNAIRGDGDVAEIKGITYIEDGQIRHNPEAPLLPDLNELPMFPHHLFKHPRYDHGFLISSRGCPYKCTYCSQRMMTGSTYRYRSADKIIEEMNMLIDEYDQTSIFIYDDNFCVKKRRVEEVCNKMIEQGIPDKCSVSIQTRADNFPADLVPLMSKAGFRAAGFGMETASQRLADLIVKEETVEQHLEAVELAKKHGMSVMLFMIYGLPTESQEERELSYRVLKEAKTHAPKFNNLIPYPGTPMFNDLRNSDRMVIEKDWSNFDSTMSGTGSIFDKTPLAYVPETTSEFELKREIVRNNIRATLSWRIVKSILFREDKFTWVKLPPRWYLDLTELWNLMKVGLVLTSNILVSFAPLAISEPLMNAHNPKMKSRPRIKDYNISDYDSSGWDREQAKAKAMLLKAAK